MSEPLVYSTVVLFSVGQSKSLACLWHQHALFKCTKFSYFSFIVWEITPTLNHILSWKSSHYIFEKIKLSGSWVFKEWKYISNFNLSLCSILVLFTCLKYLVCRPAFWKKSNGNDSLSAVKKFKQVFIYFDLISHILYLIYTF